MGQHGHGIVVDVRAAAVLDSIPGELRQCLAGRWAGDRLLYSGADDARHEHAGHDAKGCSAAGLGLQPFDLAATPANSHPRRDRHSTRTLSNRLSAWPYLECLGPILRHPAQRHGNHHHFRYVARLAGVRCRDRCDGLYDRAAHGGYGRCSALAHHAVDGRSVRRGGSAPWRREHLLHHCPADLHRYVVHALPGPSLGHAGDDALRAG